MADRTTSTVAEVPTQAQTNARNTATNTDVVFQSGPAHGRTTSTTLDALLVTGAAQGRTTSTVLEALISLANHAPGWVCVIE